MSKKKKNVDELLEEAVVPEEEQPYEVPENWRWVKLGSVISLISGRDVSAKLCNSEGKGTPYIMGASNISDNKLNIERWIETPTVIGVQGDILISVKGTIGKMIIQELEEAHLSRQIMALRCKDKVLNKYLYFYISIYIEKLKEAARGVIPGISRDDILNAPFLLPPLSEQKRIAEKVKRLLNKIEEAKRLIEEAKEAFELRRESIFKKAFSGELTEAWRKENPSTQTPIDRFNKINDERIRIIDNKRELKEVTKLFEEFDISKNIDDNNWINLKANMFCENISCGSTPKKYNEPTDKVPFLKVYNIVNNKIDFDYRPQYIGEEAHEGKQRKSKVLPDDVLMNIVGPPLRKVAIVPNDFPECNINQNMVRFRPLSFVLPKYIFYCLQYEKTLNKAINSTVGVVGQIIINISICREIEIPIPPLEEQREIVRILEELIDKEEKAFDFLSNENLIDLTKQSILSKAFRGELGTNDPSEESAIELLKEILQEQVK
ncbi:MULTISPECIES: restriction endonuclease subunit S [Bacillus cereus group]|uniref:restriction endonuclease subunit S n=1 Tax=Bacillus cereus group TaxID=86661 RepID=UPI000BEC626D|nr:restriction endonuclease subunit S [Bacillus cereus]PDY83586.1 hypothetical protein CON06_07965 [Bacillus cereus]